ncbi:Peptidase family M23 [Microbacterium hydrothermale]|uniref:M23 family metallopeptidase n=1 Tax=Microbacterium hydrothermale TaxID=857427 RepID=UPI0022267508|nr:M23 family metallopeptidase [Microbacterium hydrothermale]MCW2165061.1 Peptidase family M23 [Microbacterium hydrothermale]
MVDRQRPDAPERDFDRLMERVERLETATYGRNASVHRGSTEFVGEDSLIVRGSQLVIGTIRTIGRQIIEGLGILDVFGLINLFGAMRVTTGGGITVEDGGDIAVNGGEIRIGNILIKDGKIFVGEGAGQIVIDSATRTITVGSGAAQIVIDGTTGKITAGKLVIDPTTSGGAVVFQNGAQVFTDDDTIQLFMGNSVVQVSDGYARLQNGGDVVEIDGDGVRMSPGAVPVSNTPEAGHWMQINPTTGRLVRVPPGVGGPDGGAFEYPFPESTISDTFRPPNRPSHNGLDFAGPEVTGHMIPAAARGVVTFSGGSPTVTPTSGYGYYVVVNHGMINGHAVETWYAHMATTPPVSQGQTVAKGDLLGPVGNTGNSFGDHLHWEIHVDGEPVDPQAFMEQYAA